MTFGIQGQTETFDTVEEFMQYLDDDYNKRNKYHRLDVKYFFVRNWGKFKNLPRHPKRWYQRARYGYATEDVWRFDYYLSTVIEGACRWLRTEGTGHPNGLTAEEWSLILSKIEKGMEVSRKDYDDRDVEDYLRVQEAYSLLAQYHWDLWD